MRCSDLCNPPVNVAMKKVKVLFRVVCYALLQGAALGDMCLVHIYKYDRV